VDALRERDEHVTQRSIRRGLLSLADEGVVEDTGIGNHRFALLDPARKSIEQAVHARLGFLYAPVGGEQEAALTETATAFVRRVHTHGQVLVACRTLEIHAPDRPRTIQVIHRELKRTNTPTVAKRTVRMRLSTAADSGYIQDRPSKQNEYQTTAIGREAMTDYIRLWIDDLGMGVGAPKNQASREGGR
jgi:Fe2+ or Zn2+ uptake regulation protein